MPKIVVVGLGPGSRDGLPLGTYQMLKSGLPVYLRTRIHPVVEDLVKEGISFSSFDDLYESGEKFSEIYQEMAARLLKAASESKEVVYAVPGHPLMAEQSVHNLLQQAPLWSPSVEVEIGSGQSFFDSVCALLKVDPIEGLSMLDGTSLSASQLRTDVHTLIAQVYNRRIASEVKLTLMELYPDEYLVTVVRAAGVPGEERFVEIPLYELDHVEFVDHLTTVYVPPAKEGALSLQNRDAWRVASLVERLRAPDGCPWDRKQTHESLRPYVLEEAYEVASAIDDQDPEELCKELGDLLLQVLLHAQIASENGDFTLRDVFQALGDKLIHRHPHVFGDVKAGSATEAEQFWQSAKQQEQGSPQSEEFLLAKVQRGRPAWQVALEMQDIAAKAGFDWNNVEQVMDKVKEETVEIEQAIRAGDADSIKNETGDLLFTIVNVLRWLNLDLESVLAQANKKFENRFRHVERRVHEHGGNWERIPFNVLEQFWNEAKIRE